jgi:hypothetical protein
MTSWQNGVGRGWELDFLELVDVHFLVRPSFVLSTGAPNVGGSGGLGRLATRALSAGAFLALPAGVGITTKGTKNAKRRIRNADLFRALSSFSWFSSS